jgi:hypothetical protein
MKQVTPETTQEYMTQLKRFNMGAPGESDCPVFDGMYEYFAVSPHHSQHLATLSSTPAPGQSSPSAQLICVASWRQQVHKHCIGCHPMLYCFQSASHSTA